MRRAGAALVCLAFVATLAGIGVGWRLVLAGLALLV